MNNILKDAKPLGEMISPEGVEEKIIQETSFIVTQTQGGKFRSYVKQRGELKPVFIEDSKEKAFKRIGEGMIVMGGLITDPERMIKTMLDGMKKG